MTGIPGKNAGNDADFYCTTAARCEPEPPSPVEAMPTRRGVLIITADRAMGDPASRWLSAGYDVRCTSSADDPLDDLPRDVDVAVLHWTDLGRTDAATVRDDGARAGSGVQRDIVDPDAVNRLGTFLKRLTARCRNRHNPVH